MKPRKSTESIRYDHKRGFLIFTLTSQFFREFAISAPRAISVGEFSERLQEAKKNGVRDAQLSRLLAHLQQYNPEELVADKVLREWPL